MNLTEIPADLSDVQRIFSLSKSLIDQYEDIASIDYDRVLVWVRRKIEENIAQYRRILYDGSHAGYYRLCPAEDGWELDDLYVFPEYQNRGIGSGIIRRCCACGPVILYVFTKNTRALALYRHMGFHTLRAVGTTRLILRKEASHEDHQTCLL